MMENMSYEQAVKKLEKAIQRLEKGDLSLDETVELYNEATKLSGYCTAMLDNAKTKISELSSE